MNNKSKSGSRGFCSPSPHNTPHAGPHGAFPLGFQIISRTLLCYELTRSPKNDTAEITPRLVSPQPPDINTHPVGFIVFPRLVRLVLVPKGSALHPVPTITMGVWLLWRLLTSDRSPCWFPRMAQPV